jgi:hypothetical protein
MWEMVKGVRYDAVPPLPGYVRRFAGILWRFAHRRPGVGRWLWRFVRRLGSVTERGGFDLPVGPEFVVALSYRVVWRRGRVAELDIVFGGAAALSASGIAKAEYDLAWYEPLSE